MVIYQITDIKHQAKEFMYKFNLAINSLKILGLTSHIFFSKLYKLPQDNLNNTFTHLLLSILGITSTTLLVIPAYLSVIPPVENLVKKTYIYTYKGTEFGEIALKYDHNI